jgi:hypothetical protein
MGNASCQWLMVRVSITVIESISYLILQWLKK